MSRHIAMRLVCLGFVVLLGCVESAPEVPGDGGSAFDASTIDMGTSGDAGLSRPSLEIQAFEPARGSLDIVGHWYFSIEEGQTSLASVLPSIDATFAFDSLEPVDLGARFEATDTATVEGEDLFGSLSQTDEFSIELWIEPDRSGDPYEILTIQEEGAPLFTVAMADRRPLVKVTQSTFRAADAFGSFMSHVVVTYRQGMLSLYFDGALAGAWRLESNPIDWSSVDGITLGNNGVGGFDGVVAMVALWRRSLGEAEVFQHFLAGWTPDAQVAERLPPGRGLELFGNIQASPAGQQSTSDVSFGPESADDPNDGTLEVSSDRRFLLRSGRPQPFTAERTLEATFATIVLERDYVDALDFEVAAVWRRWAPNEVTWGTWREQQAWELSGGAGPEDRSEPFAMLTPQSSRRMVLQIPDGLIDFWHDAPAMNGGLMVFRDPEESASIREFASADSVEYRRPYFARLIGGGEIPQTPLAAPEGLRRENPERENQFVLRWAPVPGADYYDVFINGQWTRRTKGLTAQQERPGGTENRYRVVARDWYGRVSPWSEPLVTNEGL